MFVDHIRIFAKAGDGGAGSSSFRRESKVPRGGPDGGDGGDGGSVILRVDHHTASLISFFYEPHIRAKDGGRGARKKMTGKTAPARIVPVPAGTMVYRLPAGQAISDRRPDADAGDAPESRSTPDLNVADLELVADLTADGQEFVLCKGGKGGRGNVHFKSATNQAPTRADPGGEGEEGFFYLELRMIADAGLVGHPNAGKSTLLSKLSAAKPKVAAYPFTTLHPLIGILEYADTYERATIADIPGLIEGAHNNVGLGHEFLRHILRCRMLLHVIDMAGSEGRNPLEDLAALRKELSLYSPLLADRPWMVVANKMDLPEAEEHLRQFRIYHPKQEIIPISAESGLGMDELREVLRRRLIHQVPAPEAATA
jgi:GTP-binding protein